MSVGFDPFAFLDQVAAQRRQQVQVDEQLSKDRKALLDRAERRSRLAVLVRDMEGAEIRFRVLGYGKEANALAEMQKRLIALEQEEGP